MKKSLKKTILQATAKAVLGTSKMACGAASNWDMCQPKEPAVLKKMIKK